MTNGYHIVVCGSIVPDPLQTLEPVQTPTGPALKNEMMLPAVLDPWAAHALYEAANLASKAAGSKSKVWLVSVGPKAKLQQVMMTIAQRVSFELVPVDASASGFADAHATAALLAETIQGIPGLDRSRLLVFGGWESASRGAGATMQLVGERLGILDSFKGWIKSESRQRSSRRFIRSSGADRGRASSGFGVPGSAGFVRLGDRQSAGAAQQSSGWDGEHAHGDARAAAGEVGAAAGWWIALPEREPAETTAPDARGQGPVGRPDRARDCGMDGEVDNEINIPIAALKGRLRNDLRHR